MAYRDNVSALAKDLGISNDPGLREEDILVAQVSFVRDDGSVTNIPATDMNRAGRLFFQNLAMRGGDWDGVLHAYEFGEIREDARRYFAELWEPNPVPGKRKMLDALRDTQCVQIEIFRKQI